MQHLAGADPLVFRDRSSILAPVRGSSDFDFREEESRQCCPRDESAADQVACPPRLRKWFDKFHSEDVMSIATGVSGSGSSFEKTENMHERVSKRAISRRCSQAQPSQHSMDDSIQSDAYASTPVSERVQRTESVIEPHRTVLSPEKKFVSLSPFDALFGDDVAHRASPPCPPDSCFEMSGDPRHPNSMQQEAGLGDPFGVLQNCDSAPPWYSSNGSELRTEKSRPRRSRDDSTAQQVACPPRLRKVLDKSSPVLDKSRPEDPEDDGDYVCM